MRKHTLGPWYEMTKGDNEYQSQVVQESTGKTVALTYTHCDADARLIAAAPELLAELSIMVAYCQCGASCPRCDRARAVIAKAEGRES